MAFSSVGSIGTSQLKSSGTTLTLTPANSNGSAGRLVVLLIALDNTQTTDGSVAEISGITDTNGNTWGKIKAFCNGQGASGDGATIELWYTVVTTGLDNTDTITITFANTITAKACSGWAFSTTGTGINIDDEDNLANDGADAGSLTLSGMSNIERLYIRAIAIEVSGVGLYTVTTNYTEITGEGTSGGGGATNMAVWGEFRILTGTGDTSDPTTASADQASIYVALSETTPGAGTNHNLLLMGAGN